LEANLSRSRCRDIQVFLSGIERAEFLAQIAGLLDKHRVRPVGKTFEPEVAVAVSLSGVLLAGARIHGGDRRALDALVGFLIEHRRRDETSWADPM